MKRRAESIKADRQRRVKCKENDCSGVSDGNEDVRDGRSRTSEASVNQPIEHIVEIRDGRLDGNVARRDGRLEPNMAGRDGRLEPNMAGRDGRLDPSTARRDRLLFPTYVRSYVLLLPFSSRFTRPPPSLLSLPSCFTHFSLTLPSSPFTFLPPLPVSSTFYFL